jgi:hypothetical protein
MKRVLAITMLAVGAWSSAAVAQPAAGSDSVEFRYVHKPGKRIVQRLTGKTVGSMKLFDPLPEIKFSQHYEQDIVNTCRRVNDDGSAEYEAAISRVAMRQSTGGVKIDFDSATYDPSAATTKDCAQEMIAKVFGALTSCKFTITVGADGQPTKVQGLREAMNKVVDQIGKDTGFFNRKILDSLRTYLDDKVLAESMKQYYRMMPPAGPKRIGDKWESSWSMPMPFSTTPLTGKGMYELVGVEDLGGRRCAKVRVREAFSTEAPTVQGALPPGVALPTTQPASALPVRMSMKSADGEGTAYIDLATGDLVRLRQTQNITLELGIAPDPAATEEVLRKGFGPMVQSFKTSVSMDLLEGEAAVAPKAKD